MLKTFRTVVDAIDLVNRRRAGERFISNSSFVLRNGGVVPCTEPYGGLWKTRPKPTERVFGLPNNCSAPLWQMWLACFGPQKLRHMLLRRLGAAKEPLNSTSPANENGQATRSPRSSLKSSPATKCETSVSVHGHSRRAF